ncbi:hypothetical protein BJX65DRAFT_309330 [Aspergillus insuetus]
MPETGRGWRAKNWMRRVFGRKPEVEHSEETQGYPSYLRPTLFLEKRSLPASRHPIKETRKTQNLPAVKTLQDGTIIVTKRHSSYRKQVNYRTKCGARLFKATQHSDTKVSEGSVNEINHSVLWSQDSQEEGGGDNGVKEKDFPDKDSEDPDAPNEDAQNKDNAYNARQTPQDGAATDADYMDDHTEIGPWKPIWEEVYDRSREDGHLLDASQKDLDIRDVKRQISVIAQARLDMIVQAKFHLKVGEKHIAVGEQVSKVVQTIIRFKNSIAPAVTLEPHASLAWSGIMTSLLVGSFLLLAIGPAMRPFYGSSNRYSIGNSVVVLVHPYTKDMG